MRIKVRSQPTHETEPQFGLDGLRVFHSNQRGIYFVGYINTGRIEHFSGFQEMLGVGEKSGKAVSS